MKIVDFGDFVFRNLSSPDDISIASVCSWARFNTNLGKLNSLIGKNYSVNSSTLEIVESDGTEIGTDEAAIYSIIYSIDYNDRQIRRFLGAGGIDVNFLQEANLDQGVLRFTSRNEVAKSFIQIKKDLKIELDKIINYYNFRNTRPIDIVGDDINTSMTSSRLANNTVIGNSYDNLR